jgi:hypothetical protein
MLVKSGEMDQVGNICGDPTTAAQPAYMRPSRSAPDAIHLENYWNVPLETFSAVEQNWQQPLGHEPVDLRPAEGRKALQRTLRVVRSRVVERGT